MVDTFVRINGVYLVRVQCSFRASPNGEKEGVLNQPTTGDVAFPLRPFTGEPVGARVGPTAYAVQQRRYLLNILRTSNGRLHSFREIGVTPGQTMSTTVGMIQRKMRTNRMGSGSVVTRPAIKPPVTDSAIR